MSEDLIKKQLHLVSDLSSVIGCPNKWGKYNDDPAFKRILFHYWEEIATKHFKMGPIREYFQKEALNYATQDLINQHKKDLKYWRLNAEKEYALKTNIFQQAHHMDPIKHEKHWIKTNLSMGKLAEKTQNGPSKYLFNYSKDKLELAIYDAIRFNWRSIAENAPDHLYVRFKKVIGFSLGKESRYVRFDLNYTDYGIHSHPILEDEKPIDQLWLDDIDLLKWFHYEEIWEHPTIDEELDTSLII